MFDIDKYLNEMEIKDMNVSEEISARIKKRLDEEQKRSRQEREASHRLKKALLIAVPAAAVLLIGVLLGAWFFSSYDQNTVAYYTVDVNPSLCVHVDTDGKVTSVVSQNEDAQAILDKLELKGDNVKDAIKEIIAAIKDAGYFDAGQRYVLIGCFAADGTLLQSTMADLQAELEADFGDMIDLLIVSGSLEDMQQADQLKVSAGLLKLAHLADGVDVKENDKVEDVVYNVNCINQENYCAPELSAVVADKINLSWDAIDFEAMGYAGKVRYSIAAANTEEEAKSGEAPIIKALSFYTYGEQTRSISVTLDPGVTKYFALYAQYGDTVKCSNTVCATMPGELVTPSPSPSGTDAPEPSVTPLTGHTVTGRISGGKVILSWAKETADNFDGYKIVASKDVANPSCPANGYIKYITNRETTSFSVYAGFEGLQANETYYFSVTYLFKDGTTVAANAVRLKIPVKTVEPDEYPSSTIYGSISGETIVLEWSEIKHDDLDGYKVVYSFTDSKPMYDDGHEGCMLLDYIGRGGERRLSFNVSELGCYGPGATCYFSITAMYSGHTIKRAGNVKAIKMPATVEEPYTATNIRVSLSSNGTKVNFSWDPIEDDRLICYKIVGSRTDETPSYPELGFYLDAPDKSATSCSIDVATLFGKLECSSGKTCYFAVTAYYNGEVFKTGNPASLVMHAATSVTGGFTGGPAGGTGFTLNWYPISDSYFQGFQIMYSVAGGTAGEYGGETTAVTASFDSTEIPGWTAGVECRFWIRTHYSDGVYTSGPKTAPMVVPTE